MNRRIRVLHVINDLSLAGAEWALARLIEKSDASRFEHQVISLRDRGALAERIEGSGAAVYTLETQHLRAVPFAPLRLARLVRKLRPDVTQGWMYHGNLMASLAMIPGIRVPVVYVLQHGVLDVQVEKRASVTVAKAGAWLSRFAAWVVSCSWSGAKFHAGFGYRTDTMRVIPNGFDVETFRPDPSARESLRAELSLPPETPLIGMIARFARQKNHRAFLLAARALLDGAGEESAAHFVLCGNGIERSNPILAGWISELDLADRIHLLGALQDVRRVYAGVDVAASTSLSGEGFPLAVGEAMASGTPCVVSDVGDSALIVGDTGRVVAPDDPAGIAKAWRELLRMPFSERRSLGERARRRIEEHFPVSEMVRAYEALYREVARDARGRSRSPRRT